ncbi:DUF6634 family protein [Afipia felis]|uniref:Uncharacterized protein n=2 Tax=Afipia felis TaxID=1035 RepID=A0A380W4X3_AFIFE|nr:hypothetical protein HMPREF9697_03643 [Afipia felis ATCC 53690]SUU75859.1 Uncharacterised protein [Afipia felis]SUU83926.1 Uncharacterised protein [Afipia felis]
MFEDKKTWLTEAEATLNSLIIGWRPTSAELTGAPTIDNWSVVEASDNTIRLMGKVTGHPNPNVGRSPLTRTSILLWLAEDLGWARTASRYYFLGEPEALHRVHLLQAKRAKIALRAGAWLEGERNWLES